jgi:drug/metabolite transporter (DMT)-like permease
VIWSRLIFSERLSPVQWTGSALVLAGVAALSISRARPASAPVPDGRFATAD